MGEERESRDERTQRSYCWRKIHSALCRHGGEAYALVVLPGDDMGLQFLQVPLRELSRWCAHHGDAVPGTPEARLAGVIAKLRALRAEQATHCMGPEDAIGIYPGLMGEYDLALRAVVEEWRQWPRWTFESKPWKNWVETTVDSDSDTTD